MKVNQNGLNPSINRRGAKPSKSYERRPWPGQHRTNRRNAFPRHPTHTHTQQKKILWVVKIRQDKQEEGA